MLVLADHHRGGPVEHDAKRYARRALEADEKRPDQRLHPLVRHEHDSDPARVFEPLGGEVDPFPPAFRQPDVYLSEVELGELAGRSFEADHQRLRQGSSNLLLDPVERALRRPGRPG